MISTVGKLGAGTETCDGMAGRASERATGHAACGPLHSLIHSCFFPFLDPGAYSI